MIKVWPEVHDYGNEYCLYVFNQTERGRTFFEQAVSGTFVREDEVTALQVKPLVTTDKVGFQKLFDELYRLGLRPSRAQDDQSAIQAYKQSYTDMNHMALQILEKVK